MLRHHTLIVLIAFLFCCLAAESADRTMLPADDCSKKEIPTAVLLFPRCRTNEGKPSQEEIDYFTSKDLVCVMPPSFGGYNAEAMRLLKVSLDKSRVDYRNVPIVAIAEGLDACFLLKYLSENKDNSVPDYLILMNPFLGKPHPKRIFFDVGQRVEIAEPEFKKWLELERNVIAIRDLRVKAVIMFLGAKSQVTGLIASHQFFNRLHLNNKQLELVHGAGSIFLGANNRIADEVVSKWISDRSTNDRLRGNAP